MDVHNGHYLDVLQTYHIFDGRTDIIQTSIRRPNDVCCPLGKSSNWYNKDITSDEGRKIKYVTSQNGLHQEINKPTHILNNSSSCIDLIFNSQPNLLIESGVHPSLHPNCHHQIVFAKFNLDIVYPPPYKEKFGIIKRRILILSNVL